MCLWKVNVKGYNILLISVPIVFITSTKENPVYSISINGFDNFVTIIG
jgi:hypothetical protein